MLNYEKWSKTIQIEEERVLNLFKINAIFRQLYADVEPGSRQYLNDIDDDLNFIVDYIF